MPYKPSNFRRCLRKLFIMNDKPSNRVADVHLLELAKILFPYEVNCTRLYGREKSPVTRWRSEFNRGRYGKPPLMSFRYNEAKQEIDALGRPMTAVMLQQKRMEFNERFKEDVSPESQTG